eukprot:3190740-Amphidinium_carterae.2
MVPVVHGILSALYYGIHLSYRAPDQTVPKSTAALKVCLKRYKKVPTTTFAMKTCVCMYNIPSGSHRMKLEFLDGDSPNPFGLAVFSAADWKDSAQRLITTWT